MLGAHIELIRMISKETMRNDLLELDSGIFG